MLSLQFRQLRELVTETGQSQEFKESLSREYSALVHAVLQTHGPIQSFSQFCCLLMLTAPVSNTVLHTFASRLNLCCTRHRLAVAQLSISCRPLACLARRIARNFSCIAVSAQYPYFEVSFSSAKGLAYLEPCCQMLHRLPHYCVLLSTAIMVICDCSCL